MACCWVRRTLLVSLLIVALLASCSPEATPTLAPPVTTPIPPTAGPTGAIASASPTAGPQPTAAASQPAATPGAVTPTVQPEAVALVNDQPVLREDYEAQVAQAAAVLEKQQNLDPATEEGKAALKQLRRQILESLIDQVLIEQAAVRFGLAISEQQVEEELTRLIGDNVEQFQEWLESNGMTAERFREELRRQMLSASVQERVLGDTPQAVEQVHARHILLSSEAEAMEVLVKLHTGEGFGDLAKRYSQDKASSDDGGDLGYFPRGVMPIEIEAVAFALSPGQLSGIVQTDFGFHILEVLEKDPAREIPEEMLVTWRENVFLQWLRTQRSTATIEYLVAQD